MNSYVLLCDVNAAEDALRAKLRGEHLAYLAQHVDRIAFGGPMLADNGHPLTMMIVYRAESRDEVDRFIAVEPYNRNGIFDRVTIHPWNQVLPETHPGALEEAIAHEHAS